MCILLLLSALKLTLAELIRNLEDLHFFSDNIWNLGMGLTAGK